MWKLTCPIRQLHVYSKHKHQPAVTSENRKDSNSFPTDHAQTKFMHLVAHLKVNNAHPRCILYDMVYVANVLAT